MTRWIDAMPAAQRNELTDAGRLGSGRFAGPTVTCCQCAEPVSEYVSLEHREYLCVPCERKNVARWERMTGSGEAA